MDEERERGNDVFAMTPLRSLLTLWSLVSLVMIFNGNSTLAATHHVESANQIESLVKSGDLFPGDTIVWADHEYTDELLKLDGVNGSPSHPITLRAATPGGVVLRGKSRFCIGVQWWVIEGFHFDGRDGESNSYNSVEFRGRNNVGAQHVRLSNCAMTNLIAEGSSSKWIQIFGRFNTIENCHLSGKNSKGALITVELGDLDANETAEHRIAWNYFADFSPQEGTDNETIRIGFSGDQDKPATCVIERNYFIRCNGEHEIITNKSSFNTYRSNTFRECNGALVLRHGHHARVEGNYFFGDGAKNAGGIRVIDSYHIIVNNYLQDLTGTKWNSAFSILGGKQVSGQPHSGYQAVDGIVVAHNSIINCKRSIFLNKAKGSRAPTGLFANNLVVSNSAPLILDELPCEELMWVGNLFYGATVGAPIAGNTSDPQLRFSDELLRPDSSGPVIDAATSIELAVEKDVDGQTRPIVNKDIGADEVVGAQGKISLSPLKAEDVGVNFLRAGGPPEARRLPRE